MNGSDDDIPSTIVLGGERPSSGPCRNNDDDGKGNRDEVSNVVPTSVSLPLTDVGRRLMEQIWGQEELSGSGGCTDDDVNVANASHRRDPDEAIPIGRDPVDSPPESLLDDPEGQYENIGDDVDQEGDNQEGDRASRDPYETAQSGITITNETPNEAQSTDEIVQTVDDIPQQHDTNNNQVIARNIPARPPSPVKGTQDDNGSRASLHDMDMIETNRFLGWCSLLIFSIISLAAFANGDKPSNCSGLHKWVLSVCCISTIISTVIVTFHFKHEAYKKVVGNPVEFGAAALLLPLWCGGLATIMNPANGMAVSSVFIKDANLFFSAWASFMSTMYIVYSCARNIDLFEMDEPLEHHPRTIKWYFLLGASITVLASSSSVFQDNQCVGVDSKFCNRTAFSISIGVIASLSSMFCVWILHRVEEGNKAALKIEAGFSTLMSILSAVGVAFITSAEGPASSIGNLFFSTWAVLITSLLVACDCLMDMGKVEEDIFDDEGTDENEMISVDEECPVQY